ncbi:MAG: formimidoylglutamase [Crocinitomicaceae bacterium]
MTSTNFEFVPYTPAFLSELTATRAGETKLGEKLQVGLNSTAKFVLIGVQEDIGPQANLGKPGATNAFPAFLSRFVNMQSNRFLSGDIIAIGGFVKQTTFFSTVEEGKLLVDELDNMLIQLLTPLYQNNQIPILIGGGHNNAYALIAAYNKAKAKSLEVINLDPHADCRRLEGRHSGNSFSYAQENGFLTTYSVLGLHKAYNGENMLSYLDEQQFFYSFFEEYLLAPEKLTVDLLDVLEKNDEVLGVELDLDCMKNMPTSAFTSSGLEVEQARKYLTKIARSGRQVAYVHLPEGAPITSDDEKIVGKTLAYLVHDFIANYSI